MKIMVVSPHPDDETLGAGGTLLKMKKQGNEIYWLNITNMKTELGWSEEAVAHRKEQIDSVASFYGFQGVFNLELPPACLSSMEEGEIIARIKEVYEKVKPEWIILPGNYDAHSDHHVVYNCCMACAKSFRAPYIKRITTMEIPSETEYGFQDARFAPNLYVDITDELEEKIRVMKIYDTELEERPFPRSLECIKALAIVRGGASACMYAEAFHIVKQVE